MAHRHVELALPGKVARGAQTPCQRRIAVGTIRRGGIVAARLEGEPLPQARHAGAEAPRARRLVATPHFDAICVALHVVGKEDEHRRAQHDLVRAQMIAISSPSKAMRTLDVKVSRSPARFRFPGSRSTRHARRRRLPWRRRNAAGPSALLTPLAATHELPCPGARTFGRLTEDGAATPRNDPHRSSQVRGREVSRSQFRIKLQRSWHETVVRNLSGKQQPSQFRAPTELNRGNKLATMSRHLATLCACSRASRQPKSTIAAHPAGNQDWGVARPDASALSPIRNQGPDARLSIDDSVPLRPLIAASLPLIEPLKSV